MSAFLAEHAARRGVIVLGDTSLINPYEVNALAVNLGWPVLAEPTAAPWLAPTFIAHAPLVAEKFLEQGNAVKPEVVLAVGRVGLSRPIARLLQLDSAERFWVAKPPLVTKLEGFSLLAALPSEWSDRSLDEASSLVGLKSDWLGQWQLVSSEIDLIIDDRLAHSHFSGVHVARALIEGLRPDDMLHLGSSYPARDVELYAQAKGTWATGPLRVFMNRGVNGIDGVVSTAIGEALGAKSSSYLFCGDLTLLHDLTGLLIGPNEPRPDLTMVVCDNDGGGIFSTLEHAQSGGFERVIATPLGKDLPSLLNSIAIEVETVASETQLINALSKRPSGLRAIVARVGNREQEGALRKSIRSSALN
jgi:2-succinyl-5-enolpyruvyl-6-hydroxy-3-cyclohexene-1-carboxylate synthase